VSNIHGKFAIACSRLAGAVLEERRRTTIAVAFVIRAVVGCGTTCMPAGLAFAFCADQSCGKLHCGGRR
jgi:hypothetical protein